MPTSSENIQAALSLLRAPAFAAIMALAAKRPVTYREFKLMPMPMGCDPDDVWSLLAEIRMHASVPVPYPDASGRAGWLSITKTMIADCNEIDRRCCKDSWLDMTIKSRNPYYTLLEDNVLEILSALGADGIQVGYEQVRSLLRGEREAYSPSEKVVLSLCDTLYDVHSYAEKPIDETTLVEIRARLTKKAGEYAVEAPVEYEGDIWRHPVLSYEDALHKVADMVAGRGVDPSEHPLLISLGISSLFRLCRPFSSLNACTALIVTRAFLIHSGLPVLSFFPIQSLSDKWARGEIAPPSLPIPCVESIQEAGDGVDFTPNVAGMIELVKVKVIEEEARLRLIEDAEARVLESFSSHAEVNHRQKAVILQAIRDPTCVFRIHAHQKAWNVVYATARSDLLGLESMGLFDRIQIGKAFEFVPRQDIASRVKRF